MRRASEAALVDAATVREHAGGGLGLAIAKQLTQLMGGAIGVESVPGRGSTFWFTLRVSKPLGARLAETSTREDEPAAAPISADMHSVEMPVTAPTAVTLEIGAIDQIRLLGGGEAEQLLDKIVGLYCDSVPQLLTSMQEAARRGDYVALQRTAHALKTSSQNVGAMRFADLCQDLEAAARTGSIRFERLAALESEFGSVRSKLKRVA